MDGARNFALGTHDPPLIHLVEQYLADNSNLSYINIDDMIDHLRTKYFRFNRMQRKVFGNQVRSAYFDYCKRNSTNGKGQKDTPKKRIDNVDSDIEEIEDKVPNEPKKNFVNVNAHLSALYKNASKSPIPEKTKQPTQASQHFLNTVNVQHQPESTSQRAQTTTAPQINADDSDDDLEIIDEVQGRSMVQNAVDADVSSSVIRTEAHNKPISTIPSGISVTLVQGKVSSGDISIASTTSSNIEDKRSNSSVNANLSSRVKSVEQEHNNKIIRPCENEVLLNANAAADIKSKNQIVEFPTKQLQTGRGVKRKQSPRESDSEDRKEQEFGRKRKKREIAVVQDSGYRLSDFAGSEKVVEEVCRLLMHLKHPEVYKSLGVTAPRGFLLHGPPGTGKTLLANAIAGELQVPMLKISGTEFVSGVSGESESNIRDLFNQALTLAPSLIFIDEIDSITPKRENTHKEMERRIVSQLLSCVDDLMHHERGSQVLLIGATSRIETIDTSLRRAGRFDKEICLGIPDEKSRYKILEVICRNLRLAPGLDLKVLAKLTPGYVGADLEMLVREAAVQAVNKALFGLNSKDDVVEIENDQPISAEIDDPVIVSVVSATAAISNNPVTDDKVDIEVDESNSSHIVKKTISEEEVKEGEESKSTINGPFLETETSETEEPKSVINPEHNNVQQPLNIETDTEMNDNDPSNPNVIASDGSVDNSINNTETKGDDPSNPIIISTDGSVDNPIINTDKKSADEKMDIDDHDALNTSEEFMPQITSVSGGVVPEEQQLHTENEEIESNNISASQIVFDDNESGVSSSAPVPITGKKKQEDPTYMRWIQQTAPLTASQLDEVYIFMDDFEEALKHVQPSSKREGFATVPDTTWDDIGALANIREELEVSILGPVKHSRAFQTLGLNGPAGVLLCGPPGCGKTLLAKAVANEAGINFISVKGPELLNMYVGESERAVRQCFLRAKNSSPCVIFFDEIDALCPRRSNAPESGGGSRVVNQLLTEMDGIEGRLGVFIMAATNRPDILDPAILRPGRLDKILYVDLPSATDRFEILKAITKNGKKPVLSADVDLKAVAESDYCNYYTGADLAALVREASIAAFKELVLGQSEDSISSGDLKVAMRHFEVAFLKTKPSVTKKDRDRYEEMKVRYSHAGGR